MKVDIHNNKTVFHMGSQSDKEKISKKGFESRDQSREFEKSRTRKQTLREHHKGIRHVISNLTIIYPRPGPKVIFPTNIQVHSPLYDLSIHA